MLLVQKDKYVCCILIGPMILSMLVYSSGLIHTMIPDELIKFVQVIFGTIIGFTFRGVKLRMIIKALIGTFGHFIILAIISGFFIIVAYYYFNFPIVSTTSSI